MESGRCGDDEARDGSETIDIGEITATPTAARPNERVTVRSPSSRLALAARGVTVAVDGRRVRFGRRQRRAARSGRGVAASSTSWPTTSTGSTTPVTRSASIPPPTGANLADTLPPLDEFPITAQAPAERRRGDRGVVVDREVGRGQRRLDARGRRGLQQRGHHAERRFGRRRRPALHRVGHGLPVHRPRRGAARRPTRRRTSCGSRWPASSSR